MSSTMPSGWHWVKLDEIVESFKRGPFGSAIKKSFFVPKGLKVYEQKNAIYNSIELGNYFIAEDKFQELKDFETGPGDFIISCSGTIGKIYRLPENAPQGIINQALLRVRLKEQLISEKYFLELFKSSMFQKKMLVETRGSAMLNIAGVKELKQIPIPLPPLAEQKKIVEKIEELFSDLDSGVDSLKKAKKQIKLYRQSVLTSAFSGRLNEKGKIDAKTGLPEGWEWMKLCELTELITKGASPRWQGFEYINDKSQTLFITSENVRDNYLDISRPKYLQNTINEKLKRSVLKKGDVLFNLVGASIGRATVFDVAQKSNINQAVALIRLNYTLCNKYLSFYLNSDPAKKHYMNEVVDFARANLSLTDTAKIPIPLCSVEKQSQIVEEIEKRLSEADNLEKAIDESLKKSESLRHSILKKAFEGKLV